MPIKRDDLMDKKEYTLNVLEEHFGYQKSIRKYSLAISVFVMPTMKEYLCYITADSIDVHKLTIDNYTIEFLDPLTQVNDRQAYDAELFEEIYNVAFDQLYKIIEEETQAV